jgi:hypothetical protein
VALPWSSTDSSPRLCPSSALRYHRRWDSLADTAADPASHRQRRASQPGRPGTAPGHISTLPWRFPPAAQAQHRQCISALPVAPTRQPQHSSRPCTSSRSCPPGQPKHSTRLHLPPCCLEPPLHWQPQHSTRPCPTMLPELPRRQPKHSTGYAPPCCLGAALKGSPTHSTRLCSNHAASSRLPQQPKHSTRRAPPCCLRASRTAQHQVMPNHAALKPPARQPKHYTRLCPTMLSGAAPPAAQAQHQVMYQPLLCASFRAAQAQHQAIKLAPCTHGPRLPRLRPRLPPAPIGHAHRHTHRPASILTPEYG